MYLLILLGRLVVYPYLWFRGRRLMGPRIGGALAKLMLAEALLYILCLSLHRFVHSYPISRLLIGGVFIFFSTFYGALLLLAIDLLRLLDRQFWGVCTRLSQGLRRGLRGFAFGLFVLTIVGTMLIGYRNVRYPKVVHQSLHIGRLTDRGEKPQHHLRLLQVSDLHIGEAITLGFVERAVDLMLEQKADLILICGDYIDHDGYYAYQLEIMQQMRRLRATPLGVYYVLGNHEYRADSTAKQAWVDSVGGVLLRDRVVYPADSLLCLIGRDDYVNVYHQQIDQLTQNIRPERPVVLMSHTPTYLDSLQTKHPIDLALYGHTHGGQNLPLHLPVWLKYGILSGTKQVGQTLVSVTSGIGSSIAPYRIGSRSELVVWDLYW